MTDSRKQGRGRHALYKSDEERKAARAKAARERRARERAQGIKEVRRKVKMIPAPLASDIIDLSQVSYSTRHKV